MFVWEKKVLPWLDNFGICLVRKRAEMPYAALIAEKTRRCLIKSYILVDRLVIYKVLFVSFVIYHLNLLKLQKWYSVFQRCVS